jgi:hypothetical protein
MNAARSIKGKHWDRSLATLRKICCDVGTSVHTPPTTILKSVVKTLGNTSPFVVKVFARDTGL